MDVIKSGHIAYSFNMLKIDLINREDLIQILMAQNGKLNENECLITICDVGEQRVINSKFNILSLQFDECAGVTALSLEQAQLIFEFLNNVAEVSSTKEITLIISSSSLDSRLGSIYTLALEIINSNIIDLLYLKEKNYEVKYDQMILTKLYLPVANKLFNTPPF